MYSTFVVVSRWLNHRHIIAIIILIFMCHFILLHVLQILYWNVFTTLLHYRVVRRETYLPTSLKVPVLPCVTSYYPALDHLCQCSAFIRHIILPNIVLKLNLAL